MHQLSNYYRPGLEPGKWEGLRCSVWLSCGLSDSRGLQYLPGGLSNGVKQLPRLQPLLALQAAKLLPGGQHCWGSASSRWLGEYVKASLVLCRHVPGTCSHSFCKHLFRAHAVPGQALSPEGKDRASAPSGLSLHGSSQPRGLPVSPPTAKLAIRVKCSGNTGDGRKNSVTIVDSAWRRCQRTLKVNLDLTGPRESRGSGPERQGVVNVCVVC